MQDSVPVSRTVHLLEEGDPQIKLEVNSEWDLEASGWVYTTREEDHFDKSGNELLHLESSWDSDLGDWRGKKKNLRTYDEAGNLTVQEYYGGGVDDQGKFTWILGSKSTLVYDSAGNSTNAVHYQGDADANWVPVDSFVFVRDSLAPNETYQYRWSVEGKSWSLFVCKQSQEEWNSEGLVSSKTGFRKDRLEEEWLPYDSISYSYTPEGSRSQELDFFWSEGSGTWQPEKKVEHNFVDSLNMKILARYKWDAIAGSWVGYSLVLGSLYEDSREYVVLGSWNVTGDAILWMSKTVKEFHPEGRTLSKNSYSWDANLNDWLNSSLSTYHYDENQRLFLEEIYAWISGESEFELDKKVYHYYSGDLSGETTFLEPSPGTLMVYPNPVENLLFVSASGQIAWIDVLNIKGQKLFSTYDRPINTSDLSKGFYLIQVHLEDGTVQTRKVIKR
ncbi:MAG: T9SS type A sorting domain-containing protein [Bacteroidota bacterium]